MVADRRDLAADVAGARGSAAGRRRARWHPASRGSRHARPAGRPHRSLVGQVPRRSARCRRPAWAPRWRRRPAAAPRCRRRPGRRRTRRRSARPRIAVGLEQDRHAAGRNCGPPPGWPGSRWGDGRSRRSPARRPCSPCSSQRRPTPWLAASPAAICGEGHAQFQTHGHGGQGVLQIVASAQGSFSGPAPGRRPRPRPPAEVAATIVPGSARTSASALRP